jgi:multidrug efflux pump
MTSTSRNSMSNIVVQFKSDANITDTMRELKDKVDFAKKDLPVDAQEPIVKEFSLDDSPIWVFAIS